MSEKPMRIHEYRVGSPVMVKGKVSSIADPPRNEEDPFGYKITGCADAIQEEDITPIPITEEVLRYYGFKYNGKTDYWSFKAKGHDLLIDLAGDCTIDGKDYSIVRHLHVLKNLLFDECDGFVLRHYYGPFVEREL